MILKSKMYIFLILIDYFYFSPVFKHKRSKSNSKLYNQKENDLLLNENKSFLVNKLKEYEQNNIIFVKKIRFYRILDDKNMKNILEKDINEFKFLNDKNIDDLQMFTDKCIKLINKLKSKYISLCKKETDDEKILPEKNIKFVSKSIKKITELYLLVKLRLFALQKLFLAIEIMKKNINIAFYTKKNFIYNPINNSLDEKIQMKKIDDFDNDFIFPVKFENIIMATELKKNIELVISEIKKEHLICLEDDLNDLNFFIKYFLQLDIQAKNMIKDNI